MSSSPSASLLAREAFCRPLLLGVSVVVVGDGWRSREVSGVEPFFAEIPRPIAVGSLGEIGLTDLVDLVVRDRIDDRLDLFLLARR